MKSKYDILVIGGGPGGAVAARTAAELGLSVCLVEKRPAIGSPVRCAEGIGKEGLKEFIDPDPRWISADIKRARIVTPNGTTIEMAEDRAGAEVGYVLDRKIFDKELAWQASMAGADVYVRTRAVKPIMEDGCVKGATVKHLNSECDIRADVTIAADGVESKFSRWCGIDTTVPLREMMSCVQYLMTNIDIDPECNVFYLGNEVAPEGYLWIFAKGDKIANVGIGISARKNKQGNRAKDYLDRFVEEHFPDGKIIEEIYGGDPVSEPLERTVSDGLIIVGDAARMVDPITGGGIYNAMFTGRLAAQTAAKCIKRGDVSKEALAEYETVWKKSKMNEHLKKNYIVKEFFITLSDKQLNDLGDSIAAINIEDFSVLGLIKELIKRNPAMLLKLTELRELIGI